MSTVRLRRLAADYAQIEDYVRRHPRLKLIQFDGDPPERYQLEYRVKSLRQVGGDLEEVKSHLVEIVLPRNYPRVPPQCRMLSPVFHPNIAPHAICVGDHWSAGESLKSIVMRIGEILAYQSYNVKSPLNGEAARWVEEHEDELPLDRVSMLVEDPPPDQTDVDDNFADFLRSANQPSPPPRPVSSGTQLPSYREESTKPVSPSESATERKSDRPDWMPPKRPDVSFQQGQTGGESKPVVANAAASDTFQIRCPQCDTKYRIPQKSAWRKAECKTCHTVFVLTPPLE